MSNGKFRFCLISLLLYFFSICNVLNAQSKAVISIDECYFLARSNYPEINKLDVLKKLSEYDLQNVRTKFYPQLTFLGQATYQSETVGFGEVLDALPGDLAFPSISKDQYRLQAEVNQLLYDGGSSQIQKALINANTAIQDQNIESKLYVIQNRVNSIYFAILLIDAQLQQNETKKSTISSQIQKTEAALKFGTAFRSSLDELKAEKLTIDMTISELNSNRLGYLEILSSLIGQELSPQIQFALPTDQNIYDKINRPELKTFELQNAIYSWQDKQLKTELRPIMSAFVQGAYGRPTINIIDNSFGPWYIAGLRFNWSLSSFYTLGNKRESLALRQRITDLDKASFLLNTEMEMEQQGEQIQKYTQLLIYDDEAIALRTSVAKSAEAQLSNGVITTHEYIQKLNAEFLAKQNKALHEILLLQAKYNQRYISGN